MKRKWTKQTNASIKGQEKTGLFRLGLFAFSGLLLLTSLVTPLISTTTTYAAPDDSPAECQAQGGTWYTDGSVLDPANLDPSKGHCQELPVWTASERALQWATLNGVEKCLKEGGWIDNWGLIGNKHISDKHAKDGTWWGRAGFSASDESRAGSYLQPDVIKNGGKTDCNAMLKIGLSLWSYKPLDLLCSFISKRDNGSSCKTGSGDFNGDHLSENYKNFGDLIWEKVWNKNPPSPGGAGYYLIFSTAFDGYCSPKENKSPSNDFKYVIKRVSADGTITEKTYEGRSHDDETHVYTSDDMNEVKRSCKYIADKVNEHSVDYAKWAQQNPAAAMEDSEKNFGGDPQAGNEADTSCSIDGIGWIVCPVMNFMANLNDAALSFLGDNFLNISPGFFEEGGDAEAAWKGFRDIANILFVLLFLFIIYSQMTGAGISNYGIKRMLPKLIIAAILVNISFILCRVAIDLSNIVGANISQFFATQLPTGTSENGETYDGLPSWAENTTMMLAAGITVGLALLAIAGIPALLAFAMIVLILIARKAIIILLVVTAPVAFVAYLLPNTEGIFKKWWGLFKAMLLLYPIIGVVFGASVLAAGIINNTGENGQGTQDPLLRITALAVLALPLFAVPLLLKGALAGLGSVGTKLSRGLDKAQGMASGNVKKGRSGEAIAAFNRRRDVRRVNRRVGDGVMGKINRKIDGSKVGRIIGGDRGAAAAVAARQKMEGEAVDNSIAFLQDNKPADVIPAALTQLEKAHKSGDAVAARAATRVLASQTGSRGIDELHKKIREIEARSGSLHQGIDESVRYEVTAAGMKPKDRALDKWSRHEPGDTSGVKEHKLAGHDNASATPSGLNESELAGQSVGSLRHFAASGTLDATVAQRVLDAHRTGTIHLDNDKLDVFTRAVDGSATTESGWLRK